MAIECKDLSNDRDVKGILEDLGKLDRFSRSIHEDGRPEFTDLVKVLLGITYYRDVADSWQNAEANRDLDHRVPRFRMFFEKLKTKGYKTRNHIRVGCVDTKLRFATKKNPHKDDEQIWILIATKTERGT